MEPDLYHVAIVVADLRQAMRHLEISFGYRWLQPVEVAVATWSPDQREKTVVTLRAVYSASTPRLELIEEVPGTIWVQNDHSNLHHIGFWSSDVEGDSEGLRASGCPMQLADWGGGSATASTWAYHWSELGVRIEIVSDAIRALIEGQGQ